MVQACHQGSLSAPVTEWKARAKVLDPSTNAKLQMTFFNGLVRQEYWVLDHRSDQGWLILQNDTSTIGLFQGMFEKNILTFNPGWDESAQTIPGFTDVREIEKKVMAAGFSPVKRVEAGPSGPAHFVISDPDGNVILIDQHV